MLRLLRRFSSGPPTENRSRYFHSTWSCNLISSTRLIGSTTPSTRSSRSLFACLRCNPYCVSNLRLLTFRVDKVVPATSYVGVYRTRTMFYSIQKLLTMSRAIVMGCVHVHTGITYGTEVYRYARVNTPLFSALLFAVNLRLLVYHTYY